MRFFFPLIIGAFFLIAVAIPIGIAVVSAMGFMMPWLVVAFVAWAFFASSHGSRRRRGTGSRWGRHYWRSESWPEPSSVQATSSRPASFGNSRHQSRNDLPIEVQLKAEQITHKVDILLGYASKFPPFSKDLYIVRQTATDYLPRTVNAYLALPQVDSDRLLPGTTRTALAELKEQLDLLDSKLDEIAVDLQRRDLEALLVNRRFLEERFGRKSEAQLAQDSGQAVTHRREYTF